MLKSWGACKKIYIMIAKRSWRLFRALRLRQNLCALLDKKGTKSLKGYGTTQTGHGTTPVGCKGGSRYVDGFMVLLFLVLWFQDVMFLWFEGFMVFWCCCFMVLWFSILWLYGFMVPWFQKSPNFHDVFKNELIYSFTCTCAFWHWQKSFSIIIMTRQILN